MIQFNKTKAKKRPLTQEEAFAAIGIIAIKINDNASKRVYKIFGMALDNMKLFEKYSPDALKTMLHGLMTIEKEQGLDILYQSAVSHLPGELTIHAYTLAKAILLTEVRDHKKCCTFMERLAHSLEIPEPLKQQTREELEASNKNTHS